MGIISSIIPLLFSIVAAGEDFFGITFAIASISICAAIGAPFILIGKYGIKKYKKNIEKSNVLSQKGILIKNMPYEIKTTGTVDLLIDPNDISNYFIDFEIY